MPSVKSRFAALKRHVGKKDGAKKIESAPNTKPEVEPAKKLGFLDLPPEIRNKIYEYAIPRKRLFTIYSTPPRIMQTCRQVRAETRAMFYRNNTFMICTCHKRHKLAAETWLTEVYPTVGTLLKEIVIESNNISLMLKRIRGTDKWAAAFKRVEVGIHRFLMPAQIASVFAEMYGLELIYRDTDWYDHDRDMNLLITIVGRNDPHPHGVQDLQWLIECTRRYDDDAARGKLDKLVRPPPSSRMQPTPQSPPLTRRDYLNLVWQVPLLPILLTFAGVVHWSQAREHRRWMSSGPKICFCEQIRV